MIPKIIHYCWYGLNPLPQMAVECIKTWEKYMPDFQIKQWNENNSPMNIKWIRDSYKQKAFAFVADYVRLYALYTEGGIYLDTDVLVIKSLDKFLAFKAFLGFEDAQFINGAILGCEPNFPFIKEILDYYDKSKFSLTHLIPIPQILTLHIKEKYPSFNNHENQCIGEIHIFKPEYFYPIHYTQIETENREVYITENTHTIHLWHHSWKDEFWYFENNEKLKGTFLAIKRILRTPFLPFPYYRAFIKYLLYFLFGKKNVKKTKEIFLFR